VATLLHGGFINWCRLSCVCQHVIIAGHLLGTSR